jgi:hypothetical protein
MAQIMEFLLNLLLLRGKFLTTTATETFHEAIKKCMQFKRRISMEYTTATQMIGPFENMLEFINYNASQYTCEGENFVVTSEVHYQLYEHLNKMKSQEMNSQNYLKCDAPTKSNKTIEPANMKIEELSKNKNINAVPEWLRREKDKLKKKEKVENQDYIVDNLHAILKSQEFLFKNIIKLVNILEKDEVLNTESQRLEKIKKKLSACTDVLANSAHSRKFSNIINNIIEEEITRCRFRHGESKTSAEINLKIPKPEGIEAALDSSHKKNDVRRIRSKRESKTTKGKTAQPVLNPNRIPKSETIQLNERGKEILRRHAIDLEVRTNSENLLKRAKSEPILSKLLEKQNKKVTKDYGVIKDKLHPEIENSRKMIKANEEHFNQFEDALWHSLTTMKFMSLKNDYLNMCKCAFYNKRQFTATESAISKKVNKDDTERCQKILTMSDSMFQIMERKLLFEEVEEKVHKSDEQVVKTEMTMDKMKTKNNPQLGNKLHETETKPEQHIVITRIEENSRILYENPFKKLKEEYSEYELKHHLEKLPKTENLQQVNPFQELKTASVQLEQQLKENKETSKSQKNYYLQLQQTFSDEEIHNPSNTEKSKRKNTVQLSKGEEQLKIKGDVKVGSFSSENQELHRKIDEKGSKTAESVSTEILEVKENAKEQNRNTTENSDLQKLNPNISGSVSFVVPEKRDKDIAEGRQKVTDSVRTDQETNTIINGNHLAKIVENMSEATKLRQPLNEEVSSYPTKKPESVSSEQKIQMIKDEKEQKMSTKVSEGEKANTHLPDTKQKSTDKNVASAGNSVIEEWLIKNVKKVVVPDIINVANASNAKKIGTILSEDDLRKKEEEKLFQAMLKIVEESPHNEIHNMPQINQGSSTNVKGNPAVEEFKKDLAELKQKQDTQSNLQKAAGNDSLLSIKTNEPDLKNKKENDLQKKSSSRLETKSSEAIKKPEAGDAEQIRDLHVGKLSESASQLKTSETTQAEQKPQIFVQTHKKESKKAASVVSVSGSPDKKKEKTELDRRVDGHKKLEKFVENVASPIVKSKDVPDVGKKIHTYSKNNKKIAVSPRRDTKKVEENEKGKRGAFKNFDAERQSPKISPRFKDASEKVFKFPVKDAKLIPNSVENALSNINKNNATELQKKRKKNPLKDQQYSKLKTEEKARSNFSKIITPKVTEIKNKESIIHPGQIRQEKNSKLQTVTKDGKVITLDGESPKKQEDTNDKSVTLLELKSEADLLDMNKKAFEELENTIRTVRIFINKSPVKSSSKPAVKSTTESKKRKIDEPVKKSMSTKYLATIIKQKSASHKITNQEKKFHAISKAGGDDGPRKATSTATSLKKNKRSLTLVTNKDATKYALPNEKCKTFLKKSTKPISLKTKDPLSHKIEARKSAHSLSSGLPHGNDEKSKSSSQMRRTTKNAMKRQQVLTIFPKISREGDDKKKPHVSLVETEEMKAAKTAQTQKQFESSGRRSATKKETKFGTAPKTISPQNIFRNYLTNKMPHKESCEKINSASWEEEEDLKIDDILKD